MGSLIVAERSGRSPVPLAPLPVIAQAAWVLVATIVARPWLGDLAAAVTLEGAVALLFVAVVLPGWLAVRVALAVARGQARPLDVDRPLPPITLLVAARDEAAEIGRCVRYALASRYPGDLELMVLDDGSTDGTADIVRALAERDPRIRLVSGPARGKAQALSDALGTIATPIVATIDADTLLLPESLARATARLVVDPRRVAVGGSILARNSRANALTRMQEWDYFLAIASARRHQALIEGPLVAQGAFTVYRTDAVVAAGGWPDAIGEDLVLTQTLLRQGGTATFEPSAIAFTDVPTGFGHFVRQRQRWARGTIESLRRPASSAQPPPRTPRAVVANALPPVADVVTTIALAAGLALAVSGSMMILGPVVAALAPLNAVAALLVLGEQRRLFREAGLVVRRNLGGLVAYLVVYPALLAPISVVGYLQELVGAARRWD